MIDWGNVPSWVSAVLSLMTLGVAVTAAWFARGQLELARTLREEKARPFVVVDLEPARGVGRPFMDLVVRNIGETLARDVHIEFDPPLASTLDDTPGATNIGDAYMFRNGIPSMPPGREYRALFEDMPKRYDRADLPRQYKAVVTLTGRRGREEPTEQVLDLDVFYGPMNVQEYGTHHIAKTLRAWAKKNGVNSF